MEITNSLRKFVKQLSSARARCEARLFVVEGTKCVKDICPNFALHSIFYTHKWAQENSGFIGKISDDKRYEVKNADIERMSSLSTAPQVLAVCHMPDEAFNINSIKHRLVLALDRVQDPGNLGTIIRTADWFGVTDILASHDSVDVWNAKTIQSTMGAISRVRVHYVDLPAVLNLVEKPIYGTFLDGEDIYRSPLSSEGIILMGNEGQGISDEVAKFVNQRLLIPSFPADAITSESLNVASATAIVLSEFRRRQLNSRN